jgi:hypothetical protein
MLEGHPYLTKELDQKRVQQRRILRSIPDWILDARRYGPYPTVMLEGADRPFVESLLRELADQPLADLSTALSAWKAETETARIAWFVARETADGVGNPNLEQQRIDLIVAANNFRQGAEGPRSLDEAFSKPLAQSILLLAWADELADDGYTDPRLADLHPPS